MKIRKFVLQSFGLFVIGIVTFASVGTSLASGVSGLSEQLENADAPKISWAVFPGNELLTEVTKSFEDVVSSKLDAPYIDDSILHSEDIARVDNELGYALGASRSENLGVFQFGVSSLAARMVKGGGGGMETIGFDVVNSNTDTTIGVLVTPDYFEFGRGAFWGDVATELLHSSPEGFCKAYDNGELRYASMISGKCTVESSFGRDYVRLNGRYYNGFDSDGGLLNLGLDHANIYLFKDDESRSVLALSDINMINELQRMGLSGNEANRSIEIISRTVTY